MIGVMYSKIKLKLSGKKKSEMTCRTPQLNQNSIQMFLYCFPAIFDIVDYHHRNM